IPKSPPHNLFGHVDLSKLPVDRFPVTVSFFCDLPDKLFSGNREVSMEPSKFRWGQRHGFVSADRALGLLRLTRRVEVAAVERDRLLPVAGLSAFGLNLEWLSLRCEVCDHTGQILAREWPVEICRIENRGQAEWESCRDVIWTGDVNVRNYLYRRGFTPFHAEPSLPAETSAYEYIGAVSASDAAIRDSGLTQAFWRRLLLMGTVVAGTPEVCDEISRRIGLAAGSGVLNAALLRSDQELRDMPCHGYRERRSDRSCESNDFTLVTSQLISEPIRRALKCFSTWFLVSFVLVESLVIGGGFLLLKGTLRVRLWLLAPGVAPAYALAGWLIAKAILPFQPLHRIIETVYSYRDWPERCSIWS
ncbi:MAG: hypothetical protein HZB20_06980, partial [Chloroflexi bacterium]|nr:hypothetical protein [Chloroflexota bacterium]